jgi:hypothetical protein
VAAVVGEPGVVEGDVVTVDVAVPLRVGDGEGRAGDGLGAALSLVVVGDGEPSRSRRCGEALGSAVAVVLGVTWVAGAGGGRTRK